MSATRPFATAANDPSAAELQELPPWLPARKTRYLRPGELVVCSEPTTVVTVLGSCVAVCLWDRSAGVGAVNHYLLPDGAGGAAEALRYGPQSVVQLVERVRALGCRWPHAKVFGGASVLASLRRGAQLGASNVAVARELLSQAGVPIVAEDVGGDRGRRLVFQTDTGLALVKRL